MTRTVQAAESVGCSSERLARIRPVMQSYVDQRGFAGITTMLARHGRVIHFEQVGWQDRENGIPLAADTIFRIYSMTKPVVCTALMTLYEEGRFQLLDPLAKFLPQFGKVRVLTGSAEVDLVRPILVRDLFTHTAGLTYTFLEDSPVCEMYRQAKVMSNPDQPLESVIAELARLPLVHQPGTKWNYSMSIDVLGHLIEVISEKPLQDFLQERFFAPLGMTDTGFAVSRDKRHRIAAMYGHPDIAVSTLSQIMEAWQKGQNERLDVESTNPSSNTRNFARGGYGLFSTASDYMRFAQMLLNRGTVDGVRIFSPKTVDFMHMNHLPAALIPYDIGQITFPGYGFGLGSRVLMNVAESGMPGSVGEFGWAGAAKTYYWIDPQEQMIGLFLSQYMVGFDLPEKDLQVLTYQAVLE
ncbi:MAG TPA: serine hydrolase domain-containing protein [Terriglobia bacterium]|nr:serine hydrolase domain-containing protein [Terriglobia bacterium]